MRTPYSFPPAQTRRPRGFSSPRGRSPPPVGLSRSERAVRGASGVARTPVERALHLPVRTTRDNFRQRLATGVNPGRPLATPVNAGQYRSSVANHQGLPGSLRDQLARVDRPAPTGVASSASTRQVPRRPSPWPGRPAALRAWRPRAATPRRRPAEVESPHIAAGPGGGSAPVGPRQGGIDQPARDRAS